MLLGICFLFFSLLTAYCQLPTIFVNCFQKMQSTKPWLIVVGGPTAVGKTELCIRLAEHYGTEIISADSRQFYRETELATAKPSLEERQQIKHHLVDSLSIHNDYDVGKFEQDALGIAHQIFQKNSVAIVAGGSGLYMKVLCEGMDEMPEVDDEIREKLIAQLEAEGLEYLQAELKLLDPEYYQQADIQNPQRLIRALEVIRASGLPYSSFRTKKKVERPFHVLKICLNREREELYQRIDLRMDQMIAQGLFEEAKTLYPFKNLNALQTVGYSEIFGFMDGLYDQEEAIRLLKRNSRRYAKRQLTWFRKDQEFVWFHPSQFGEILNWIGEVQSLKFKV